MATVEMMVATMIRSTMTRTMTTRTPGTRTTKTIGGMALQMSTKMVNGSGKKTLVKEKMNGSPPASGKSLALVLENKEQPEMAMTMRQTRTTTREKEKAVMMAATTVEASGIW